MEIKTGIRISLRYLNVPVINYECALERVCVSVFNFAVCECEYII